MPFIRYLLVLSFVITPALSFAQALGTFRWQLQPYCNVVTLNVSGTGAIYRLEGTDDQCGGGPASTVGTAFPNLDGSIGLGLTIVSTPGAAPVHVDATIQLPHLNGTWRDSAGSQGNLVLTNGPGTGGTPRATTGTIGASAVNPAEVQLRVAGTCATGQAMQTVQQDGSVTCGAIGTGTITRVTAGVGLVGGGSSGEVTVGLRTTATGAIDFSNSAGLAASAPWNATGSIPESGAGKRLMWYPGKYAFRAGQVSGSQWDDVYVGQGSVAMGENTTASGSFSAATGYGSTASGYASAALGTFNTASGNYSAALGYVSTAAGQGSLAVGEGNSALGAGSVALGYRARAQGNGSFVFADRSSGTYFAALGENQFRVRAAGGVGFYTSPNLTSGVELHPGSGSWSSVSDVNAKENFRDIDGEQILGKLAAMPVRTWNYKTQATTIRHAGPTAQDFKAAFGLGESDRQISTIDADGVALAAAQALEARTRTLLDENQALADENHRLRERLADLERSIAQLRRSR
jgi:hypothetical protein